MSAFFENFGSPLFKVAFGSACLGLGLSLASFAVPGFPAATLSFFFCACWLVWSACALRHPANNSLRLLTIWVLIDLAILAMFLSITGANGDVMSAMGTEVVWLISYLPTIIPLAFARPPLAHELEAAARVYTAWIGPTYGGIFSSWLAISFIAMVQSFALVLLARIFYWSRFKWSNARL
jgi:hypothetical protein